MALALRLTLLNKCDLVITDLMDYEVKAGLCTAFSAENWKAIFPGFRSDTKQEGGNRNEIRKIRY